MKPLPIAVLIYSINSATKVSKTIYLIQIGFVFSMMGDFIMDIKGTIGIHSVLLYSLCHMSFIGALLTIKNST